MRGFLKLLKIEFKLYFRDFGAFFFTLVFPVMLLLIFGSIYGNEPADIFGGLGYIDTFIPALMYFVVLVTGIMMLPVNIVNYRENKILKRYKVTPISPAQLLIAQGLINMVVTAMGSVILFVCGKLMYDIRVEGSLFPILIAIFLGILMTYSLGFLVASLARSTRSVNAVSNMIYFPMMFLSGCMIPLSIFPDGVETVSKVIPGRYAVELLQNVFAGKTLLDNVGNIIVLLAISAISIVISVLSFKWE